MKKSYIIGIIVTVILAITTAVIIVFYNTKNSKSDLKTQTETQLAEKQIQNQNQEYNLQMISTLASEEKASPMALLIFKTKYNSCGHIITNRVEIPKELVNKTEDEIKKKYEDWIIEEFTANQITFYKEKDGICNEHYMLREKNGYLAIYTIDLFGNETLKEMTQIVTSYLPETDIMRLKEGIQVNGKEELNATLEDYE